MVIRDNNTYVMRPTVRPDEKPCSFQSMLNPRKIETGSEIT